MDTVTIRTEDGLKIEVPVVAAFGADGMPAELIGDIEPENCDHAGAGWSSNLDLRCPRCGSRLFLPPRFLARRTEDGIEAMHALWVHAGWPAFRGDCWAIVPDKWTIMDHPLFTHVDGLAVRNDRLDGFPETQP